MNIRAALVAGVNALLVLACTATENPDIQVNAARAYPQNTAPQALPCTVDVGPSAGTIDRRLFGTNLEWFNEAGGLAAQDPALRARLLTLTREQGVSVLRFPGGTLADYYHWRDGTGPVPSRPERRHPTDSGHSANRFGSPELFKMMQETGSEALITVNAGTGTADEAAAWVAYANRPGDSARAADGYPRPIGIHLWEIGNELYLPGNPGELKITVSPEVYAQRYLAFSRAMKAVDPSIRTLALAVTASHTGPDTPYPDWTRVVLQAAAREIDLVAVHNAYFPMLYREHQPPVDAVYPALWAAPEAVDRSLTALEQLLIQYEGPHPIGIAVTEWGALFSLPNVDNQWVDHVKTMGSGVYVARMLQVMMSHPRVELANYFKLTDRSFMGWIDLQGEPKVPYWVFALYARHSGSERLHASLPSPHYDAAPIGTVMAEHDVPEVTVLASRDPLSRRIFVNLVNRSLSTRYPVQLRLDHARLPAQGQLFSISAAEPTAHNGRDIPPEWPYRPEYEPYSSAAPHSLQIKEEAWDPRQPILLAPFSVATLVLTPAPLP